MLSFLVALTSSREEGNEAQVDDINQNEVISSTELLELSFKRFSPVKMCGKIASAMFLTRTEKFPKVSQYLPLLDSISTIFLIQGSSKFMQYTNNIECRYERRYSDGIFASSVTRS